MRGRKLKKRRGDGGKKMRQETRSERSVKHGGELKGRRENANANANVSGNVSESENENEKERERKSESESENASENVHMSGSVKRDERKDADGKNVTVKIRMKRNRGGSNAAITALTRPRNHLHRRNKSLRKLLSLSYFGRVKWLRDHANVLNLRRTNHWSP
jgi:hypothetical protein